MYGLVKFPLQSRACGASCVYLLCVITGVVLSWCLSLAPWLLVLFCALLCYQDTDPKPSNHNEPWNLGLGCNVTRCCRAGGAQHPARCPSALGRLTWGWAQEKSSVRARRRSLAGSSGTQRLQHGVDGALAGAAPALEQQGAVRSGWLGLPPAAVPRSCAASDHVVGEGWENTKIQIFKELSNWHFPLKNLIKGDRFPQEFKCHIHIYSSCIHIPYKGVPICCSGHNLSNVKSVITQIDYLGPSIHLVINMNCNLATGLIPSLYYLS